MESSNEKDLETYIHKLSVFYCLDNENIDDIWVLLMLFILFNDFEGEKEECTEVITDKICNK